ncbi:hypothetical protein F0U60_53885 [Archangium minus]|uniref:Uncharacterized protein n=1 Tax=Archangium minus TaxID=83450 RepID=A0ABY9X9H6_9BACT|nr:hypothetical protein F0U60_53885 [Archangium minus]
MQMVLEDLGATTRFDALPASIGPHVELASQKEIPVGVVDPVAWVEQVVLPHRPIGPDDQREGAPYAPRREAVGNRFFQTWKVAHYVRRHFRGETLSLSADYAGQITHFVPGSRELLLMEPVVGTRVDVRKDLREISQTFLAWSKIFDRSTLKRTPRFCAYIISGSPSTVSEAHELLTMAQAEVINVETPNERDRFLNEIRRVGRTNPEQGGLPIN